MNRAAVLAALSRSSLSVRILAGLGLGIVTGLFFGESTRLLQPLADIYIRLMQMTVLPYLVMALIIGFGQLNPEQARRLAWRGGALLLVTWGLAFAVIAALPLAFPAAQSASFFSHALVEPKQDFSIADLYFTANPFHSLANAVVPAVVLFSSLIGIGLIGLEGREQLLGSLRVFNAAIVRVTGFIIGLTPLGVFAIGAVTTGTMTPETFSRLEVYFIAFAAAALLLAFWVLPLLVTALTPFSYRDVVGIASEALLTAYVASNAFIVLPILVERSKVLLRRHGLLDQESDAAAEILIPILFNFPNAGRLLTLLFIPFAAWMAGSALEAADYWSLLVAGIPSYFAKAQVALPFLLDLFGLPHDLFQLYLPTTILTGKFDSLVTAMNLLVFALLGSAAMGGWIRLRWRLLRNGIAILAGIALTTLALRLLFSLIIDTSYHRDEALRRMHTPQPVSTEIVHRDLDGTVPDGGPAATLAELRARGVLRVGYDPMNLPFSFFNADGQLVGFDIELARSLAESLGVRAEFIPIPWRDLAQRLAEGRIDVMPSVWYRPYWFASLRLSVPYLTGTMGIVVRDERRHAFANIEDLHRSQGLRIGVPLDTSQIAFSIRRYFGDAPVEFVPFDSADRFFAGEAPQIDGYLMPAENASAATLLHPEYTVVVPQPNPVKIPFAFGLALDADELAHAVDEWVLFATSEGLIQRTYDYWVLGRGAEEKRPRWSILHDVLGY